MKFEEKIFELRKKRGWSQEQLAVKLSVSRQAISKWESGVARPDTNKLILLSKVFEVTLDSLVNDDVISSTNNTLSEIKLGKEQHEGQSEEQEPFVSEMQTTNDVVAAQTNKPFSFIKIVLVVFASCIMLYVAIKWFPLLGVLYVGIAIFVIILMVRKYIFQNPKYSSKQKSSKK